MILRLNLNARLTVFFLSALALVLLGFSLTIYLGARLVLSRQIDERLEAGLDILTSAVERDASKFEWEPNQRYLALGRESFVEDVRWAVVDGRGRLVDRSKNLRSDQFFSTIPLPEVEGVRTARGVSLGGGDWRILQRRLGNSPQGDLEEVPNQTHLHDALVITTGLMLEPAEATLRQIGRILIGVSVGIWALAAVMGGRFARGALRPLTRMADAAHNMDASEPNQRLPSPGTNDEIQGLADAFNGLLDRLHVAFERQRRFTGDASHQFRTPLAAMLGQVEVVLMRERDAEEYRRALSLVHAQASHLNQIVESLLFLARADAEAPLPDLQVVELAGWLESQREKWWAHYQFHQIVIQSSQHNDVSMFARVHPPLLEQLVDNLLDNACKYSPLETPVLIGIERRVEGGMNTLVLSVRDAGPGIALQDLPHLFEPFFRSPTARLNGRAGVGLGLTIAERIAKSFDGRLEVESTLGQGSTFSLILREFRVTSEKDYIDDGSLVVEPTR